MLRKVLLGVAASLAIVAGSTTALAQGTAITYQGQLKVSGTPVNSATDMQFSLWTAASGGSQVGSTVTSLNVSVANGLFTTPIDFGVNPYTSSQNLFLQIAVRNPAGGGAYVPMSSRQLLSPAPFSLATRGINMNSSNRAGVLADPYFTNEVAFTLGSAGGADPAASIVYKNRLGGGDWEAGSFDNASTFGDFTINRKNLDFPVIIRGNGSNILLNSQPSGGNVGIGTPTPTFKLDVNGASRITGGNPAGGQATLTLAGANGALLSARNTGAGFAGWDMYMSSNDFSVSRFGIDFPFQISAATGNIGIATAVPQAKLDVTGTSRLNGAAQIAGSGTSSLFVGGNDNGPITFPASATNSDKIGIRIYNDFVSPGSSKIQGWNFVNNTSRLLAINPDGGNVGVGTASPAFKLDVAGASRVTGGNTASGVSTLTLSGLDGALLSSRNTGPGFAGWDVYMASNGYAIGRFGIDFPFFISATTGALGLGTGSPTAGFRLDVAGNIRCVSLTQTSTRDFKQDITPLSGALESIMKLKGVSYAWNDQAPEEVRGSHDIGFIADEMNEVLPDIVAKDANGKPIGIDYGKVTPVAVEAIKQLKNENDQLKARLEKIEAMLAAQAAK